MDQPKRFREEDLVAEFAELTAKRQRLNEEVANITKELNACADIVQERRTMLSHECAKLAGMIKDLKPLEECKAAELHFGLVPGTCSEEDGSVSRTRVIEALGQRIKVDKDAKKAAVEFCAWFKELGFPVPDKEYSKFTGYNIEAVIAPLLKAAMYKCGLWDVERKATIYASRMQTAKLSPPDHHRMQLPRLHYYLLTKDRIMLELLAEFKVRLPDEETVYNKGKKTAAEVAGLCDMKNSYKDYVKNL